jgi:hypothetical protein
MSGIVVRKIYHLRSKSLAKEICIKGIAGITDLIETVKKITR